MHNKEILLCSGHYFKTECWYFHEDHLRRHNRMTMIRCHTQVVTTSAGKYVFGGDYWHDTWKTYEYLPTGSKNWKIARNSIPRGFMNGFTIASKSGKMVWLIGGICTAKRILQFNVDDHTFEELPTKLIVSRERPRCAFIPNTNKIMITGGRGNSQTLDSTEIFDPEDGTVTLAGKLNCKRFNHGIGILTINNEDKLAVFGGSDNIRKRLQDGRTDLRSVELYDYQNDKWEISNIKLEKATSNFGFLSYKQGELS